MMNIEQIIALLPHLILALGIVLAMLAVAWQRSQHLIAYFTLAVLVIAAIATINNFGQVPILATPLFSIDDYSRFALLIILAAAITVVILSKQVLARDIEVHDEYYLLVLLTIFGASVLVISDHYASLFLGFELLSISLVGLVGYFRTNTYAVESGFKYLILSASASSFMLMGIAFIYAYTGDLSFSSATLVSSEHNAFLHQLGFILFFSGVAFKLSLVPFHFWTPDVYQGAATPITLLLASVSKCALFIVLLKCCFAVSQLPLLANHALFGVISAVAILSMIVGNSLALRQVVIKRILAYSSIAHMGYLLIIVLLRQMHSMDMAWQSALFYLAAYLLANVSIFTVVTITELQQKSTQLTLADWQGLFWRQPLLASLVILSVLSFAGIPLTAGFIGKFYLMNFAASQALWSLLLALIIGSGIALAYYLPLIFTLFSERDMESIDSNGSLSLVNKSMVSVFVMVGLLLGIYPDVISLWLQSF